MIAKAIKRLQKWLIRKIQKEIDICNLPNGEYTLIYSSKVETFINWNVYDHKSRVKDNHSKIWIVLSRRPLPNKFFFNGEGVVVVQKSDF